MLRDLIKTSAELDRSTFATDVLVEVTTLEETLVLVLLLLVTPLLTVCPLLLQFATLVTLVAVLF
jgi:hypothetical protein